MLHVFFFLPFHYNKIKKRPENTHEDAQEEMLLSELLPPGMLVVAHNFDQVLFDTTCFSHSPNDNPARTKMKVLNCPKRFERLSAENCHVHYYYQSYIKK